MIKNNITKCPSCKVILNKNNLRWIQGGDMIYKLLKQDGFLIREPEEFDNSELPGIFCCIKCGFQFDLTEKNAKKIIK